MIEVEQNTRAEQERHADVYGVSREDLTKKQQEEKKPGNGGEICSICHVKGCRIGPMLRG